MFGDDEVKMHHSRVWNQWITLFMIWIMLALDLLTIFTLIKICFKYSKFSMGAFYRCSMLISPFISERKVVLYVRNLTEDVEMFYGICANIFKVSIKFHEIVCNRLSSRWKSTFRDAEIFRNGHFLLLGWDYASYLGLLLKAIESEIVVWNVDGSMKL